MALKPLGGDGIKPEETHKTKDNSKTVPVVQKSNFGSKAPAEFLGKGSPVATLKKSKS